MISNNLSIKLGNRLSPLLRLPLRLTVPGNSKLSEGAELDIARVDEIKRTAGGRQRWAAPAHARGPVRTTPAGGVRVHAEGGAGANGSDLHRLSSAATGF